MSKNSFFFLLTFIFMNSSAFSTKYYVDNSGDDLLDGSFYYPFETLQHAADIVQPGDTVYVMGGIYTGFYLTTSGTATERITFLAEQDVVIDTPNAITDDGINLEGASFITIEGFLIENMPRAGIRSVNNEGVRLLYNDCSENGVWGIFTGFSEGIEIGYNLCQYSIEEHGIYLSNSADNAHVHHNLCSYNNGAGIHINGDESMGGDGVISNLWIEKNTINFNGVAGGSAINCDGVQNSRIENNLIYGNHASGISLYQIDAAEPSHNNVIANNTIMMPEDGRWGLNITNGSSNNVAFNNIILSKHSFRGSLTLDEVSMATFHAEANIYSDRISVDDGSTVISLSDWQSLAQQDLSTVVADSSDLFDIPGNYYHPIIGSLAENTGLDTFYGMDAPLSDILDETRPWNGGYEIGCYELAYTSIAEEEAQAVVWTSIGANDMVKLIDTNGNLVYEGLKKDISLPSLADGLYIFLTQQSGEVVAGKWLHFNTK